MITSFIMRNGVSHCHSMSVKCRRLKITVVATVIRVSPFGGKMGLRHPEI